MRAITNLCLIDSKYVIVIVTIIIKMIIFSIEVMKIILIMIIMIITMKIIIIIMMMMMKKVMTITKIRVISKKITYEYISAIYLPSIQNNYETTHLISFTLLSLSSL